MKKALLTLIGIVILLIATSLTSSKLNSSQTNQAQRNTENFEETLKTADTEATRENQITDKGEETTTQTNENPNEQCLSEENNQQSNPTNENFQTLQNPTQGENITPPDGRIYYPTSSEQPYAYTPTYTPKETNIPLTPIEPEN
jgi:type II secretory pathway pseudopilin PulG